MDPGIHKTTGFFGRLPRYAERAPSEWHIHILVILSTAKNLWQIPRLRQTPLSMGISSPLLIKRGWGRFTKKCYIYNIMSYPTFWHQKNQKNPTPQLHYPLIFSQKFTTIVNFTISVKIWHLFSKIHYFTESVKKFAFIFFWIILRKIHYFIE